ncbi:MAG TPA: TetR/AcrR family transcriptional regulator [Gaiellaceae bacterium]|jgi:AcrR family transcriptional regulator|nr:TetR/AcrR family transcriptional regulator [Gaiellaceae bacterium]
MTKPTAQTIVEAALDTLREEGFAGASSRAIARRGGFNQALIFYHFGSLENLRLAALRQTSEERLARYKELIEPISTLDALVPVMVDLWHEDKASGYVQVVAQLIAGSANRPELAATVIELLDPWVSLAEATFERVLPPGLPTRDIAYGTVVWYLGVNLMTHLDPEGGRTDALFARGREWAPLVAPLLSGHLDEAE